MASNHGFVGELLIRQGLVDGDGFARAVEARVKKPATWGRTLAALGLADEDAVTRAIAEGLHLEYLDADPTIAADVAALLPPDFCSKRGAVPLSEDRGVLRVAVTDPLDYNVLQDIQFKTGKKAVAVVTTETRLEKLLASASHSPRARSFDRLQDKTPMAVLEPDAQGEYDLVDLASLKKDISLPPVIRLVNLILSEAASAGASDIHIEPQENELHVRMRVDGLLREVMTIPREVQDHTISRLKIMSGMDIAERRKPQDGRSRLRFGGHRVDLRVSTLPTHFGEKVVIRLLNGDAAALPMTQLGLTPEHLKTTMSLLARPQGMILVTGPTGSGKTSTLYACLNAIKSPTNNIVTLEDPIEFQVAGLNQMQVNPLAGVTFASGLRSILRQDPNVIFVGEIRDGETADIALQAAQTGHLVFSTLHTNDAPGSITRLFDLGIQPFLVSASLVGIVAQRLVRRVCSQCAVPHEPDAESIERIGGVDRLPSGATWVVGKGCEACGQSGYKGRMAVHEIMQITDELRDLISQRAPEHQLRQAARRAGMKTLLEDGVAKAAQGLTTLEEVCRVVTQAESGDRHEHPPVTAVPEAPAVASPAPTVPSSDGLPQRRVLVVEDSPTVAMVVKYFLEIEGFEVLLASDGAAGFEMALKESPALIVSDYNMPGMNGPEMVRALRADTRTADVRVLMLTSESSVESEAEGLSAGADDYILKPVEPRRLAARVRALLGRTRPHAA